MLVDLRPKKMTGKDRRGRARQGRHHGQQEPDSVRPGEADRPRAASASARRRVTTRGMKEAEMGTVAGASGRARRRGRERPRAAACAARCKELRRAFPLYATRLREPWRWPAAALEAMNCPFCAEPDTRVADSREAAEGTIIRRRRECPRCKRRFTTFERVEQLTAAHREERRPPRGVRSRQAPRGLEKACEKRPVSRRAARGAGDRASSESLQDVGEKEIAVGDIGEAVMHAAADARRGRLRAVRVGVPQLPRHRASSWTSSRTSSRRRRPPRR